MAQKRGYTYVCLVATKYILFLIAKVLKRFYTLIHIVLLLSALAVFSLVGGLLFQLIESPPEQKTIAVITASRDRAMYDTFTSNKPNKRQEFQVTLGQYEINFIQAIKNGTFFYNGEAIPLWTFTGSTYFCVTTFTQLGFGNLAPKSTLGRVITMIYACFSIPVGAVVFADLGRRINILITLAWSFIYTSFRTCREEANKNVDDFGPKGLKTDRAPNTNVNANVSGGQEPGEPPKQTPSPIKRSGTTSSPLSEITSSTKSKKKVRKRREVTVLRVALRYNIAMSFPRILFGVLILEVIRALHTYLRRRLERRSEACGGGKRRRPRGVQSPIQSPDRRNLNYNASLSNPETEAQDSKTKAQDSVVISEERMKWLLSHLVRPRKWNRQSQAPGGQSTMNVRYGVSTAEVQEGSDADDEQVRRSTSARVVPSRGAWGKQSEKDEGVEEEEVPLRYGHMGTFDRHEDQGRGTLTTFDSLGIILITVIFLIIYTVIGAYVLVWFEAWDFFKGAWFLFMSITTVGYGDVTPSSAMFLTYFIPFIIVGISIFGNLMGLAMLFFNNITSKFRIIGQSYFDVYSAKAQLSNIEKKSKRARRWWRVLRQHIANGLPRELVNESREYKLALFGQEREFIKDAFRLYFKKTYEDRLRQQAVAPAAISVAARPSGIMAGLLKVSKGKSSQSTTAVRTGESGTRRFKLPGWDRFKEGISSAYEKFRVAMSPGPRSIDL